MDTKCTTHLYMSSYNVLQLKSRIIVTEKNCFSHIMSIELIYRAYRLLINLVHKIHEFDLVPWSSVTKENPIQLRIYI